MKLTLKDWRSEKAIQSREVCNPQRKMVVLLHGVLPLPMFAHSHIHRFHKILSIHELSSGQEVGTVYCSVELPETQIIESASLLCIFGNDN